MALPILPFNNQIGISVRAKALVGLKKGVDVSKMKESDFTRDYSFSARVYIRQKSYPYNILSELPQQKIILQQTSQTMNLAFGLKQELVQTDLADFAEIVFEFSDMVEEVYDFAESVRAKQMAIGPWYSAKIMLESLKVKTECLNPIAISDVQKYTNTLLALREGSLASEYQSLTLYRQDAESE